MGNLIPPIIPSKKPSGGGNMLGNSKKTPGIHHGSGKVRISASSLYEPTDVEQQTEEDRDDARYAYMQKRIRDKRKAMEEKQAKVESAAQQKTGLKSIGTGSAFKDSGASGFEKQLKAHISAKRSSYKGLSGEDVDVLHDIIADKLKNKSTGSAISNRDRASMKKSIREQYKSGKISMEKMKGMRKIIGEL